MLHATEHYELESKRALKAAERATTLHERIRLLETARRYAQLACAERRRSNVYAFGPARR
jgi:transcription elongation GreA/GreB family factor